MVSWTLLTDAKISVKNHRAYPSVQYGGKNKYLHCYYIEPEDFMPLLIEMRSVKGLTRWELREYGEWGSPPIAEWYANEH